MNWAHEGEVATVQRRDGVGAESLCGGDHRRIDYAEREIGISRHQVRHAPEIRCGHWLQQEIAVRQLREELCFSLGAKYSGDHECGLTKYERRNDERSLMRIQEFSRSVVPTVTVNSGSDERSGVDYEDAVNPSASRSSSARCTS